MSTKTALRKCAETGCTRYSPLDRRHVHRRPAEVRTISAAELVRRAHENREQRDPLYPQKGNEP